MKIQALNRFNITIPAYTKLRAVPFKSAPIKADTFEHTSSNCLKNVTVKDLQNNDIKAMIIKSTPKEKSIGKGTDPKDFSIFIHGERKGQASVYGGLGLNGLFLSKLNTEQTSDRNFHGLGTELLKCVIEESEKRNKKGVVITCAFNEKTPPFPFYFKNNFCIQENDENIVENATLYNGPLQYIVKHNKEVFDIIPEDKYLFFMELNEQGAKALKNGEHLYKSRICDEVGVKTINSEKHSAQFIESPNKNEYFLQVLNEDASGPKLCLLMSLSPSKNSKGEKTFQVKLKESNFPENSKEAETFAKEILKQLPEKYLK